MLLLLYSVACTVTYVHHLCRSYVLLGTFIPGFIFIVTCLILYSLHLLRVNLWLLIHLNVCNNLSLCCVALYWYQWQPNTNTISQAVQLSHFNLYHQSCRQHGHSCMDHVCSNDQHGQWHPHVLCQSHDNTASSKYCSYAQSRFVVFKKYFGDWF